MLNKRVKKKDYENLSDANLAKVIKLLNQEKPITKKEACEILNISYNTTRLNKIIEEYQERIAYTKERKAKNRGKPASTHEIEEVITGLLEGLPISDIARGLYRSPGFVKKIVSDVGIPQKPANAKERTVSCYLPDECLADSFEPGEIVWSAKYHAPARVDEELSIKNLEKKPGVKTVDYEAKYGAKCYNIYVLASTDNSESFFPGVETGGFFAASPAYELGSLKHLEKLGLDIRRL